ncbi:uncharacterized protein LOC143341152 [Colletes latitarsis]|uniref:uncharacterized protein LOC143341152 n=1 Tax=Colletes latitarsis TaxID=2605962 RepID=UPI00403681CB
MRNLVEKQLSWLALLVTTFYSLLGSCRSQYCGHERLMECSRPFERTNDEFNLPMKKEELLKMCSYIEDSMKCMQTYTIDCLKEKERESFYQYFAGVNQATMELCHDGPYQDEFLKLTPCLQSIGPMMDLCSRKYQRIIQNFEKQLTMSSMNKTLKCVCCGFKEYLECSHHTTRRHCGDDAARFTKDFFDRVSSPLLRVPCSHYTEEMCEIGSSGVSIFRMQTMISVVLLLLARYFT